MAKQKMTMKICNQFDRVFKARYCTLQDICPEGFISPSYYNEGKYGWNNDMYVIHSRNHSIIITTGYRNLRGEEIPSDIIEKYSCKAVEIKERYPHFSTWEETRNLLYSNFADMAEELTEVAK